MQAEQIQPRILLAGVPFGCDNVGDEAILAAVVTLVREVFPLADITVSTRDHEHTPKKLSVKTCPLFGFDALKAGEPSLPEVLKNQDFVIWPGATGLSDYPELPLSIMETAQSMQIPTMLFCTGMNTELNPYLYQLQPGKRKSVYQLIKTASLGLVDLETKYREDKESATRDRIRSVLPRMKARLVRDPESLEIVSACLKGTQCSIELGADPALITESWPLDRIHVSSTCSKWFNDASLKKIGLCISAQSPVTNMAELASAMDDLIEKENAVIIGLPMNPITDAALLEEFKALLRNKSKLEIAYKCPEPEEITALASQMDVVISSRLHLLILSTIHKIPIIGISRGSKVTNFTNPLGIRDVGSVQSLNVDALVSEILRLFRDKAAYQQKAGTVMTSMMKRLDHAREILRSTLELTFGKNP